MTGISLDLFTVILMVVLAFVCGYSAGHKFGRNEVHKQLSDIFDNMTKMIDDRAKQAEELRKKKEQTTNQFLEWLRRTSERREEIEHESKE